MNNNSTLVSVIIPVYNSSATIDRCIESCINQTYDKIEIITINDGSTDDSLEILMRHKTLDNRIEVLTQENGGSGAARNAGIEAASGEWIAFVDADDFCALDMIEKALEKAYQQPDADMIYFSRYAYDDVNDIAFNNNAWAKGKVGELIEKTVSIHDYPEDFFSLFRFGSMASKLWSAKFLQDADVRFSQVEAYEDYVFFVNAVLKNCRIASLNERLYYYVNQLDDNKSSGFKSRFDSKMLEPAKEIMQIAKSSGYFDDIAHTIYYLQFKLIKFSIKTVNDYSEYYDFCQAAIEHFNKIGICEGNARETLTDSQYKIYDAIIHNLRPAGIYFSEKRRLKIQKMKLQKRNNRLRRKCAQLEARVSSLEERNEKLLNFPIYKLANAVIKPFRALIKVKRK
jgi:glycosyltransferase involved in cell wall biosynthesis